MNCLELMLFLATTLLFIKPSNAALDCPVGMITYTYPDRSEECTRCSECPRGTRKVANCTIGKDTVCECGKSFYFKDVEPYCISCTVCEPGTYIVRNCSQFKDSLCEQCPNETFSFRRNSSDCTKCATCEGKGIDKACTSTKDSVCMEHGHFTATWDIILVCAAIVGFLCLALFILLHMKFSNRKTQQEDPERKSLVPVAEETKAEKKEEKTEEDLKREKDLEEFKAKMRIQIRNLSKLPKGDQLEKLRSAIGELIIVESQGTTDSHFTNMQSEEKDETSASSFRKDLDADNGEMPGNVEEGQNSKQKISSHQVPFDIEKSQLPEANQDSLINAHSKERETQNEKIRLEEEHTKLLQSRDKQESSASVVEEQKDSGEKSSTTVTNKKTSKEDKGAKKNKEVNIFDYVSKKKEKRVILKRALHMDEKQFYNEKHMERCFGFFVGSKYFMTSYHSLQRLLDRQIGAYKTIAIRFKADTFEEDDRINKQICTVSSAPIYQNKGLDVAVLQILHLPSSLSSLNLCKDFGYEAQEIVSLTNNKKVSIRLLTGQSKRRRDFEVFCDKQNKSEDAEHVNTEYVAKMRRKYRDVESGIRDSEKDSKSGNAGPLESEINNAAKVCWTSKIYVYSGLPCFFFNKNDRMFHLFCMCNFPYFYLTLSNENKKDLNNNFKIQYGTLMSALHKDMWHTNQMLCEELFVD